MDNKSSDIFELTDKTVSADKTKNFFLEDDITFNSSPITEPARHLNDYDFNILKDGAYKDIQDDTLKLECKMAKVEEDIRNLEAQIGAAKDIGDLDKVQQTQGKLIILKNEYKNLLSAYNEKALSAKISDSISGIFDKTIGTQINNLSNGVSKIYEIILSKLPHKFSSVIRLKQSLTALENINKSVDKLVTMDIPYGESLDKYNKLSRYIIKANSIQAEISKYVNKKG